MKFLTALFERTLLTRQILLFFKHQRLMLFQAGSICSVPTLAKVRWNQWEQFCRLQRPLDQAQSLLWFTVSLLNTTKQEIFVLRYFPFACHTEKKTKTRQKPRCFARYIAEQMVPAKQQADPVDHSEMEAQVFSCLLFQDKGYFYQEIQLCSCMPAGDGWIGD